MKKYFLNTNVIIDFLADRKPFSDFAAILFESGLHKNIELFVSAVSYNNTYYILRQYIQHSQVLVHLLTLKSLTTALPVSDETIAMALHSGYKDFEDAIQYYCALSITGMDAIVTRNANDFKNSTLAVLTPTEAVKAL